MLCIFSFSAEEITRITLFLVYLSVLIGLAGLFVQSLMFVANLISPRRRGRWLVTLLVALFLIIGVGLVTPIAMSDKPPDQGPWTGGPVSGDLANYEVRILLRDSVFWKKGESSIVVENSTEQPFKDVMAKYIPKLVAKLQAEGIEDIICVGTASHEVGQGGESYEEERALDRVNNLAGIVNELPLNQNIYTLNLGHYKLSPQEDRSGHSLDSSYQRNIVVIGVKDKKKGIARQQFIEDATKTLREKLEEKRFKFSFSKYSLFSLNAYS